MVAKAIARAKVYEESESGDGKLFPQTEDARPSKQTYRPLLSKIKSSETNTG